MNIESVKRLFMDIKIYSKQNCPFCEKAKDLANLLKERNVVSNIEIVDITALNLDKYEVTHQLGLKEVIKTYPQIVFNGRYIGGYTDFQSFVDDEGLLDEPLF